MSDQPIRKLVHLSNVRMLSHGGRGLATGIKITNMKSIKPPDPESANQQKDEELKSQPQKKITSGSRTCANSAYWCGLPAVTGRQYCFQHILQDPTAEFKQCLHQSANGQKCNQPAPANRDHGMCWEHARTALMARYRSTTPSAPVTTTETLLHRLAHYARTDRVRTASSASSVSVVSEPPDQDQPDAHILDPFKDIDATAVNAAYSSTIMECASGSDSDCDSVTLGPNGDYRPLPDLESDEEDELQCDKQPLWHAGVYTAEEAVSETWNTLKALRSAYIKQMDRLGVMLQMARSQYLKSLKAEKEQYCSINAQAKSAPLTVHERRMLRKLKAYAGYHKKHGVDAVLARKLWKKRAKVNEIHSNRSIPSLGRCTFTEEGARCSKPVLPAAKHCLKHILHDQQQVLFTACNDPRGENPCHEAVPRLPFGTTHCVYHTDPPPHTVFTLLKGDSDSESGSNSSSEASQTEGEGDIEGIS